MPRECKVCKLKRTHPEAYKKLINQIIKPGELSTAKFVKKLNEEYDLNLTKMNASSHKAHMDSIKGKPKKKKKSPEKEAQEMEVYAPDGELLYTNINEIIADLDKKEKLFCEAYVNIHNHNATGAYLEIYQSDTYGSAASGASRLVKKINIQLYISHLINERSKNLKISSSFVITGLMENYSRCMQSEPVIGKDGEPIGIYNFNPAAANKALELIGKHIQMWDKKAETPGNQKIFESIIEKLMLNQINPIAAGLEMGKHNLPVPDALKIAMQKVDPNVLDKPPLMDSEDMKDYSDEELERVAVGDVE